MERRERERGAVALPSRLKPQAEKEADAEKRIRSLLWRYQPEFVLGGNLDIVFTRSSNTPVSLSQRQGSGTLRLHVLFSRAPESILEDVIRFCFAHRDQPETKNLRNRILDYVGENRHQTIATMSGPGPFSPRGKIYDLEKTLRRVIRKYVPERRLVSSRPAIGWSKRPTIKLMGKWIETSPGEQNVIIINRRLDDERVPAYYLEYNVYHELLHDLFSIHRSQGRWIRHSAEFQAREKTYPLYTRAREWEINELPSLTMAENAIR